MFLLNFEFLALVRCIWKILVDGGHCYWKDYTSTFNILCELHRKQKEKDVVFSMKVESLNVKSESRINNAKCLIQPCRIRNRSAQVLLTYSSIRRLL